MSCGLSVGLRAGPGSPCGWPAACPLLQPSSPRSGRLRPTSAAQDPPNGVLLGAVTPTGSAFAATSSGPSSGGSSPSPAEGPGGFSAHFPAHAEGRPDRSGCELAIFLHEAASVARMCGAGGQLVGPAPPPPPRSRATQSGVTRRLPLAGGPCPAKTSTKMSRHVTVGTGAAAHGHRPAAAPCHEQQTSAPLTRPRGRTQQVPHIHVHREPQNLAKGGLCRQFRRHCDGGRCAPSPVTGVRTRRGLRDTAQGTDVSTSQGLPEPTGVGQPLPQSPWRKQTSPEARDCDSTSL